MFKYITHTPTLVSDTVQMRGELCKVDKQEMYSRNLFNKYGVLVSSIKITAAKLMHEVLT